MRRLCLLFATTAAAWAQLNGPMLGWTPDGSRVRPMYGLVGASTLGDPIDIGRDLSRIAPSPSGDYVIATAADDGEALLIVNGIATPLNGVSAGALGITATPPRIVRGVLVLFRTFSDRVWAALARPRFATSTPASLRISPLPFAVSDDGQSLAASWPDGAWLFHGSDAAPLLTEDRIDAIAFPPRQSTLLAATSQGVVSISNGVSTTLYSWSRKGPARRPLSPLAISSAVGIASSSDSQHIVMANHAGYVLNLNLSDGTSSLSRCDCAPEGVFGLGAAAFRLTSPSTGAAKIFDASTNSTSVVPPMLAASSPSANSAARSEATPPALPAVTITTTWVAGKTGYKQSPGWGVTLASPYSLDINGTATLTFASSVGGDDQMIQFAAGGRTTTFTIPAGTTQASFTTGSPLSFSTGTVAGTITLTLGFAASGTDITPNPAPATTYTTNPTVPFLSTVTLEQTTGGVTVVVTGFSSSRDVADGTFTFAPATGKSISNPTLTVPLSSAFATWYSNTASNAFGSEFKLTMPFPVQGPAGNIVAVTVTLTNGQGASTPVSQ